VFVVYADLLPTDHRLRCDTRYVTAYHRRFTVFCRRFVRVTTLTLFTVDLPVSAGLRCTADYLRLRVTLITVTAFPVLPAPGVCCSFVYRFTIRRTTCYAVRCLRSTCILPLPPHLDDLPFCDTITTAYRCFTVYASVTYCFFVTPTLPFNAAVVCYLRFTAFYPYAVTFGLFRYAL